MYKFIKLIIVILLGINATCIAALTGSSVQVDTSKIMLNDLFDLPEGVSNVPIAAAPSPGKTKTFSERALQTIAERHGLSWEQSYDDRKVTVRRQSKLIDPSIIEQQLKDQYLNYCAEHGIDAVLENPDLVQISLKNRKFNFLVATKLQEDYTLEDFTYHPRTHIISATIRPGHHEGEAQPRLLQTYAAVEHLRSIPVLNTSIAPGDMIRADTIRWIKVPSRQVRVEHCVSQAEMIGRTPKYQMINALTPVRKTQIGQPRLVNRGEAVSIIIKTPTMSLTAKGKANANGVKNEVISVMNLNSKRSVDCKVTGTGEVTPVKQS